MAALDNGFIRSLIFIQTDSLLSHKSYYITSMTTPFYTVIVVAAHFFTHSPSPLMPIAVFALPSLTAPGAPCPLPLDTQARGHGRWRPGPSSLATLRWTMAMATHRCGHLCCRQRRRHRCLGNNNGSGLPQPHCMLIENNDVPETRLIYQFLCQFQINCLAH